MSASPPPPPIVPGGSAIPPPPVSGADGPRPDGMGLFRLYVGTVMWLYVVGALVAAGVFFLRGAELGVGPTERVAFGTAAVVSCAFVAGLFAVALREVRAPWYWWYGLVLIGLGLSSLCCIPVTIPVLLSWVKPPTKAWFGVSPAVPDDP